MSGEPGQEKRTSGAVTGPVSGEHWRAMRDFVLVGTAAVVTGGLVAAVTGPTGFADGSWVAAYLVLVAGVAQVGLGGGQALFGAGTVSDRRRGTQLLAYNAANLAVLAGTLTGSVVVVAAGGGLLLISLALFLTAVRRSRTHPWYLAFYRLVIALLAVSVPVGVLLSVLRHS